MSRSRSRSRSKSKLKIKIRIKIKIKIKLKRIDDHLRPSRPASSLAPEMKRATRRGRRVAQGGSDGEWEVIFGGGSLLRLAISLGPEQSWVERWGNLLRLF